MGKDHLIVFADDWGRHPSSAQHLVRYLLQDRVVSWVNTIGTRVPRLSVAVVRRGLEKLLQWGHPPAQPLTRTAVPEICSPIMYPGFRTRWQRNLNAGLLARFLRRRFADLERAVIVSTIPIVADLPERLNVRRWVYYCVDDFSVWPGLDSTALRELEQKFVLRADRVIAAGENLAARMRALGREARVLSHGIDLEHWRGPGEPSNLLAGMPRPIVLFWGLIDRRLDVSALRTLNERMPAGTIALVGPEQDPDPALGGLSRVRRPGKAPYESLPALASQADVLLMPYADLPVTRAMQPLKLKEYLATDRPVVVTRLPAVAQWQDCLDVVDDPEQLAQAVMQRCAGGLPAAQSSARRRLELESWKNKSAYFADALFGD